MKFLFALLLLPSTAMAFDYDDAIRKEVAARGVALAIVVQDVRLLEGQDDVLRRKEVEDDVVTTVSQNLLTTFADESRFQLLDRRDVAVVMNEYVFQAQGFTRQVDAEKIGSFVNATHLLILSIVSQGGKRFAVQAKLTNVKEARILSAERFETTVLGTPRSIKEIGISKPKDDTPLLSKLIVVGLTGAFGWIQYQHRSDW